MSQLISFPFQVEFMILKLKWSEWRRDCNDGRGVGKIEGQNHDIKEEEVEKKGEKYNFVFTNLFCLRILLLECVFEVAMLMERQRMRGCDLWE